MSLGLRHLLEPEDLPPEFSPCLLPEEAEEARRAALARERASRPPHAPERTAGEGDPAGTDRRTPIPRRPDPEPEPRPAPPAPTAGREAWRPLPAGSWPEAWRVRLKATRPGLIAWSYAALGRDLARIPDPPDAACSAADRGNLLRRFWHEDLRYPAGTHTLWPVCLPGPDASDVPNPDAFWSGLRILKVRGLVLMGSQALRAADMGVRVQAQNALPTSSWHRGLKVWIVWSPENLLAAESRCRIIFAYLRHEFGCFLPR